MRKQQSSSSTSSSSPSSSSNLSEHPNASKRIPFFLPPQPPSNNSNSTNNHNNPQPHLPNGNGNGNVNGNHNVSNNGNGTAIEDPVANYTLQGVMQWLNGEYRRYERERNAWEIERAGLVVWPFERGLVWHLGSSIALNGDESWNSKGTRWFNAAE